MSHDRDQAMAARERVVIENSELVTKIDKLNTFITSSAFERVSLTQQALLRGQIGIMSAYTQILRSRINAWELPA